MVGCVMLKLKTVFVHVLDNHLLNGQVSKWICHSAVHKSKSRDVCVCTCLCVCRIVKEVVLPFACTSVVFRLENILR